VSHAGANRLLVAVTANRANGQLQRISWTASPNISVEDAAGAPLPGTSLTPPSGSSTVTFYVRRTGGTSATLTLTLTGSFGSWSTFVGGGPDAW